MSHKSFSKTITDSEVMINGIRDNQDALAIRQIDTAFADAMQADINLCIECNNEQESLKAKLKEKTEQLYSAVAALTKKDSEARKIVKMYMPQSSWREFGITDKR